MKKRALFTLALGLGLPLGLTSCPSGGGSNGSSMAITSCTLGCSVGSGDQVSCGVTDVYVNQEIRIAFTDPVRLSTVTNSTFQVVEVATGKTPPSSFSLDPANSRVLIYRPQLTFDSSGNPIFGLTDGATYTFKIPGQILDPAGPFIKNSQGAPVQNRLLCTLVASRGIFDANPGPPNVAVTVDRVTGYDAEGNPSTFELDVDADGATDVWRDTLITMVFDDVMNPGTLANPVTGTSTTIEVKIDPDGDLLTESDRLSIAGTFSISIDQDALITTVIFTPDGGLPSAGSGAVKRKVILVLPEAIKDLGGNSLENAGEWVFTPEAIDFDPLDIVEDFENEANEDETRTGSVWSSGGTLLPGSEGGTPSGVLGGGSGQLGDLVVPSGATVVLNTDSEDFLDIVVGAEDPSIFDPALIIDSPGGITVTGGIFEFSRVRVDAGGTLRFEGSRPARLFARGEVVVQGVIDVSAANAAAQHGETFLGGAGGAPRPPGAASAAREACAPTARPSPASGGSTGWTTPTTRASTRTSTAIPALAYRGRTRSRRRTTWPRARPASRGRTTTTSASTSRPIRSTSPGCSSSAPSSAGTAPPAGRAAGARTPSTASTG
ncbi:MAG: Ig-like domain-containing protein [Planctomycetota bacterium]